jgi:hypothetical protein
VKNKISLKNKKNIQYHLTRKVKRRYDMIPIEFVTKHVRPSIALKGKHLYVDKIGGKDEYNTGVFLLQDNGKYKYKQLKQRTKEQLKTYIK